jgi:hypothetical protein
MPACAQSTDPQPLRSRVPQLARPAVIGLAVTALFTINVCSLSQAQDNPNWKPYRPTKLSQSDENLRFRTRDLGVEPHDFSNATRAPAPASPRSPRSQPQNSEPVAPTPPARDVNRSTAVPDELLSARQALPQPEVDSSFSSAYPQTNEYVDEFDLMPQTEEMLFGESALTGPPKLTKFKEGFFQKLNIQGTSVDPGLSSGFGFAEFESMLTVAVPAPSKDFPLLISPIFEARALSGPTAVDVPPMLYTTGIDFMWVPKINDRLRGVIAVAPMVYSDFQSRDSDMFRITGKGIVQWDAIPDRLQFLLGVLYLNRDDISLFPVAGAIWNPTPYWNLEVVFPRPKLARLINYGPNHSDWVYLLGEFGGNTWAVKRDSGLQDKVTLRDLRLMLGVERRKNGGVNYRAEVGYVFAREVDYLSTPNADFTPADTLLLRLGVTF